jgi:hypothetical protein
MGLIPGIGMLGLKPKANGVKKVENAAYVKSSYHGMNNCQGLVFTGNGGWFYVFDNNGPSIKEYNGGYFDLGSCYLSSTYDYAVLGGACYAMTAVMSSWDFYFACDYYIKEDKGFYGSIGYTSYVNNLSAIWVPSSGAKVYYVSNGVLYESTMTSPNYISTRTDVRNVTLSTISSTITQIYSMWVSDDGTQILLGGYNGKLHQLILSTPWNISTATLYSTLTIPSMVVGIFMPTNGLKLFLLYQDGYIKQYSMN